MEVSVKHQILPLFFIMASFIIVELSNLHIFVEHNISYKPCKFQLSRMSGSNFTEEWNTPPPPSAAPGEKSPVLLGLTKEIKSMMYQRDYLKSKTFKTGSKYLIQAYQHLVNKVCYSLRNLKVDYYTKKFRKQVVTLKTLGKF